jgi:hypothetical protein
MRAYSVNGPAATGTANKTAVTVIGSTTARPSVFDVLLGSSTTAADNAIVAAVSRFTAAGTAGSSFTPLPLDPSDVASVATAGITHSAEPTYTANQNLLRIVFNQRATFRWVAAPASS